MKPSYLAAIALLVSSLFVSIASSSENLRKRSEIRIRDPYVVAHEPSKTYYMYASMMVTRADGEKVRGVGAYRSKDLQHWEDAITVYETADGFWGPDAIWAPEVHEYKGKYYLFATFASNDPLPTSPKRRPNIKRATQVMVADGPAGPFKAFSNVPHTPQNWMSLDGTLWEEEGVPYMIFCHEWWQIVDGSMDLVQLTPDLSSVVTQPELLFYGSEAPWSRSMREVGNRPVHERSHGWVTDGPFIYRTKTDRLLMIWSSFGIQRYAVGMAYSESGSIKGPWKQMEEPLFKKDGGHGMIFKTFEGQLMLSLHQPNRNPEERAHFFKLEDAGDRLVLVEELPFE